MLNSIPGFRIVPKTDIKREDSTDGDKEHHSPVGPEKYDPHNPTFVAPSIKFGTGTREGLKQKFFTPAPSNYLIKSDFEKA
jgi:hypothetical protein